MLQSILAFPEISIAWWRQKKFQCGVPEGNRKEAWAVEQFRGLWSYKCNASGSCLLSCLCLRVCSPWVLRSLGGVILVTNHTNCLFAHMHKVLTKSIFIRNVGYCTAHTGFALVTDCLHKSKRNPSDEHDSAHNDTSGYTPGTQNTQVQMLHKIWRLQTASHTGKSSAAHTSSRSFWPGFLFPLRTQHKYNVQQDVALTHADVTLRIFPIKYFYDSCWFEQTTKILTEKKESWDKQHEEPNITMELLLLLTDKNKKKQNKKNHSIPN